MSRKLGRELGVRYILEGGVRRAAKRLRISAQLFEVETRAHLWADKYDSALADKSEVEAEQPFGSLGFGWPERRHQV